MFRLSVILVFAASLNAGSANSDGTVLAIQDALEAGHPEQASKMIEDALRANPRDGGILNLRGVLAARHGDLTAARRDFADATSFAPQLSPAWRNLARACQENGETVCAIYAWRQVLHLSASDEEARNAIAAVDQRETDRLGADLVDLCKQKKEERAAQLAAEVSRRADFTEADLRSLLAEFPPAEHPAVVAALISKLNARSPVSTPWLQQLALAQESLHQNRNARRTLEQIAALNPQDPSHLLELARVAELDKDHEAALGYLAHARDLAPRDPRIHFLFAMVAVEMELPVEARRSLDQALELDPDNPDYHYLLGVVILTTRDAATAGAHFERYVQAKPNEVRGHYALGVADFASGDYEKCVDQMKWVLAHSPSAAGAEYFLGRIARLDGAPEEARKHLQRSISLVSNYSESHTELARVWLEDGNLTAAAEELKRALSLNPKSFQANTQLLVLYQRMHDERARKQADLVKQLDESRSRKAELMLRTVEFRP